MNIDPDLLNDDLSGAMGIKTLLAHDLVPEGLPASSKGPAEQRMHHIGGVRYLAVDQTANQRRLCFDPIAWWSQCHAKPAKKPTDKTPLDER